MERIRPLTFAVDFDGTLCTHKFPEIGEPKREIIELVRKLYNKGHYIIIWTCRTGDYLAHMIKWLRDYNVPYHTINENIEPSKFTCRKVLADYYIDDRAVNVKDFADIEF